jgi:hypothetical protein
MMDDCPEGPVIRVSATIRSDLLSIGYNTRKNAVLVTLAAPETVLTAQGFTPLHSSKLARPLTGFESGIHREVDTTG